MRTRKQQRRRDALAKVLRPLRSELNKANENYESLKRVQDWLTDHEGAALRGAVQVIRAIQKRIEKARATPRPDQVAWELIQRARYREEVAEDIRQCNPTYTKGIARNERDAAALRKQATAIWPPIAQRATA